MSRDPIIIVGGEPNSIFSEILLNSYKKSKKNKPIILFASYKLFAKQLGILKIKYKFNLIDLKNYNTKNLSYTKINIINIDYNFKNLLKRYLLNQINIFQLVLMKH